MAITVEIYEEIRQCREKYGYGQRKTARLLKVSRNTVKKYWDGSTVPWEQKQGSGRKNDVLTDEHLKFISECLEEDKQAPKNSGIQRTGSLPGCARKKGIRAANRQCGRQ